MSDDKPVKSSREISMRIADLLEQADPQAYNGTNRVQTIVAINDTLQDRGTKPLTTLLDELSANGSHAAVAVIRDIRDFQARVARLDTPYEKSSKRAYKFKTFDADQKHPLKVVNQQLFDRAAKAGFPPDFFKDTYFDHVNIYCMPDSVCCNHSHFQSCHFTACRVVGAQFWSAHLYDCTFQSSLLQYVVFPDATLSHTHFYDARMDHVAFMRTRLNRCNTIDCTMEHIIFDGAVLDGCSYAHIAAKDIRKLNTAIITQSGATAEECKMNRTTIFKALGVADGPESPDKEKGRSAPERSSL